MRVIQWLFGFYVSGKPVTISSIYLDHDVNNAVDGIYHQSKQRDLAHAGRELRPWIEVDLGQTYNIDGVKIFSRTDCCSVTMTAISNICHLSTIGTLQ